MSTFRIASLKGGCQKYR